MDVAVLRVSFFALPARCLGVGNADMKWIIRIAVLVAALYVLLVAALYFAQRRFMYLPDTTRVAPASLGLKGVAEKILATPDGARLVTWRLAPRPGAPTILYFHGNAANLASRRERVAAYRAKGYGLLMLSYRGFGGSTGTPTEANLYADAALAYQTLRDQGVAARDIIAYGESLGTGVAVELATGHEVGAVILDAPYTSIVDVAQKTYPYIWVRPFIAERYDSLSRIAGINAPLLVLHGDLDPLIPIDMPRLIYARAKQPKKLVEFKNGHHSDLYEHGAIDAIADFLAGLRGA